MKIILASQSPRRRELLTKAGYEFSVEVPDASLEDEVDDEISTEDLVAELSLRKARFVSPKVDSGLIIAADTVAECEGKILGKPDSRQHAAEMLTLMSGKRHRVLTGVTLWHRPSDRFSTHVEETVLLMDPLPEAMLSKYLATDDWKGKAGGFGFQDDLDWLHIVEGLESNVVGLPVERLDKWTAQLLKS